MGKHPEPHGRSIPGFWAALLIFAGILLGLFWRDLLPGNTLASNDGPLGTLVEQAHKMPEWFKGTWEDLNLIGSRGITGFPSPSYLLLFLLKPILFSKLWVPLWLLILGLCAWWFFRRLDLTPAACLLGGIAAMLNSGFFSAGCWGLATHPFTVGMAYFALAALLDRKPRVRWVSTAVAGLAVGTGVSEGADIGAIFSVLVATFLMYMSAVEKGFSFKSLVSGAGRLAVVVFFAGFIAAQAVSILVATNITGVAGTQQDQRTKQERWDFATQWSLPKTEALAMLVPGLFGYRMDTPQDMAAFEHSYDGGSYWGAVGRDPSLSRAFDAWVAGGKQGPPPSLPGGRGWRFTGGGNYPGILVLLVAAWACAQSFRKEQSVFSLLHRKFVWFWLVTAALSLLLAFGRFAPFYQILYALPYASVIRNPAKFLHVVNFCLVVLFGFGVHGLARAYLAPAVAASKRLHKDFDRKWLIGCGLFLGLSLLGWAIYANSQPKLEEYLGYVGLGGPYARVLAAFSLGEVGWYITFLTIAILLICLILFGKFSGPSARFGGILLGLLLVVDLGRANQPWIIVWNYKLKYATNPVIDLLREKPYEHRVAVLPGLLPNVFRLPEQLDQALKAFDAVYGMEWSQHVLLYYDVQSLDVVQMRSTPEDLEKFLSAFQPRQPTDQNDVQRFVGDYLRLTARKWQLTNTRYLLGLGAFLDALNKYGDSAEQRFRIARSFNLEQKQGTTSTTKPESWTASSSTNGPFALIDFTGALPRAKLYSNWQVVTNADATLARLVSPDFDPIRSVLVADPLPAPPTTNSTNQSPGSVEYLSYAPKRVVLHATAESPSVLLLNDRYDPNWKLWVDGKPDKILHCNYLMRGVQVAPGTHTLEFRFDPPLNLFYITVAAQIVWAGLLLFLVFSNKKTDELRQPASKPMTKPASQTGTSK